MWQWKPSREHVCILSMSTLFCVRKSTAWMLWSENGTPVHWVYVPLGGKVALSTLCSSDLFFQMLCLSHAFIFPSLWHENMYVSINIWHISISIGDTGCYVTVTKARCIINKLRTSSSDIHFIHPLVISRAAEGGWERWWEAIWSELMMISLNKLICSPGWHNGASHSFMY